jgi:hypothetical protein
MKLSFKVLAIATALIGASAASLAPAQAQPYYNGPVYNGWQAGWDRFQFDRRHVILGTVSAFQPFRVTVLRRNGNVQLIDLKNGTVILPTGATPAPGEHIAIVGYYSQGTFIANRLILRG